jgi:hypothetical protein
MSQLYCGFVRERGTLRTSTRSAICAPFSKSMNSSTGRVEWPMVKKGFEFRVVSRRITAPALPSCRDDAI